MSRSSAGAAREAVVREPEVARGPHAVPAVPHERSPQVELIADVRRGLTQSPKRLSSKFLYDPLGSALFDAICRLPWYEVTRAEHRLLARHAPAILAAAAPSLIVELGPGAGEKLAALVNGAPRPKDEWLHLHLIDISSAALARAAHTLGDLPRTRVTTTEATYEQGIARFAVHRHAAGPALVLFLGSNIGNFDPPEATALLTAVHEALRPGDTLLLGADLVKPAETLRLAYDDPLGVTAAFNKNLLARLNSELGADFALDRFAHLALWREEHARVEMHLVSRGAQRVTIPAANLSLHLSDGETIWTENSYKYEPADIDRLGHRAGFERRAQWIDQDGRFALTLFTA